MWYGERRLRKTAYIHAPPESNRVMFPRLIDMKVNVKWQIAALRARIDLCVSYLRITVENVFKRMSAC